MEGSRYQPWHEMLWGTFTAFFNVIVTLFEKWVLARTKSPQPNLTLHGNKRTSITQVNRDKYSTKRFIDEKMESWSRRKDGIFDEKMESWS